MTQYDILKVKNALVKCTYCVAEGTICCVVIVLFMPCYDIRPTLGFAAVDNRLVRQQSAIKHVSLSKEKVAVLTVISVLYCQ